MAFLRFAAFGVPSDLNGGHFGGFSREARRRTDSAIGRRQPFGDSNASGWKSKSVIVVSDSAEPRLACAENGLNCQVRELL
jgi:hypothetical protein